MSAAPFNPSPDKPERNDKKNKKQETDLLGLPAGIHGLGVKRNFDLLLTLLAEPSLDAVSEKTLIEEFKLLYLNAVKCAAARNPLSLYIAAPHNRLLRANALWLRDAALRAVKTNNFALKEAAIDCCRENYRVSDERRFFSSTVALFVKTAQRTRNPHYIQEKTPLLLSACLPWYPFLEGVEKKRLVMGLDYLVSALSLLAPPIMAWMFASEACTMHGRILRDFGQPIADDPLRKSLADAEREALAAIRKCANRVSVLQR